MIDTFIKLSKIDLSIFKVLNEFVDKEISAWCFIEINKSFSYSKRSEIEPYFDIITRIYNWDLYWVNFKYWFWEKNEYWKYKNWWHRDNIVWHYPDITTIMKYLKKTQVCIYPDWNFYCLVNKKIVYKRNLDKKLIDWTEKEKEKLLFFIESISWKTEPDELKM
jgi:hypothetical protein